MAGHWVGQGRVGQGRKWQGRTGQCTPPEARAGGYQPVEKLSAKGRNAPQLKVLKVAQRIVAQDL